MRRTVLTCSVLASVALLGSAVLIAGPLSPPPGPVTSTYKTLNEIEPRTPLAPSGSGVTITQPGSYYLTGNISATLAAGIRINASNVTLDLGGFRIASGVAGIIIDAAAANVTIHNGTIAGGSGIVDNRAPDGAGAQRVRVSRVTMDPISDAAIRVGAQASIDNVLVQGQPATFSSGITVGPSSLVTNTIVDGVRGPGFALGEGTRASFCTASNITEGDGFFIDARVHLVDCTALNINGNGVNTNPAQQVPNNIQSVLIERCTISNVSQNGVFLQGSSGTVRDNSISNVGFFSTYVGPQATGVLISGSSNRVENNRLFRVSYPVFITANTAVNSVVRNTAVSTQFPFTNQGSANNFIAPVGSGASQIGPWDNSLFQ